MIRQFVDSIVPKYSKRVISLLKKEAEALTLPNKQPLTISTGLPERIPIYRSFFHIFFPKSFQKTYLLKKEILLKTKRTVLPPISVSVEKKKLIMNSTVTVLLNLLNEDHITSQEILYTFMERSQQIGIDMNYITDLNIEEAFEEAKRCDEIRRATPRSQRHKLGLLFGIPFSVKENILQKGFDSTCGLATRCFMPSERDSIAVKSLKKEGAIPFARSTVPQLLSVIETVSHIWNRAYNPWDLTRSTGGSSGGEAGLISTSCSPIGIGTDGLGSLRIPATWCGIYSFKPSCGRLSWKKSIVELNYLCESRWNVLYPSIGPMGKSVDDLILLTKCLANEDDRDRDIHYPALEWNDKETQITKKLKIGYVLSEEMFGSCKAMKRAVLEAVEELKRQNHEVEEIQIPNFNSIIRVILALMTSDGMSKGNLLALNGEDLIQEMKLRLFLSFIPGLLRRCSMPLVRAIGEERAAYFGNWTAGLSGEQWQWVLHEKEELSRQLFNFWKDKDLDAIITPGSALPALRHGTSGELALNVSYLWVANMFNLPAGIVPVSRVEKGEDNYESDDSVHHDWLFSQTVEAMKETQGLPVGVQVLTLPFEDEKCLGIMKLLNERFPAFTKS